MLRLLVSSLMSSLVMVALAGCAGGDAEPPRENAVADPGLVHIHGVGRNPADGSLVIATHTGLFRLAADGGTPARVGRDRQDTMGFTVVGPDHFLGSGHPATIPDDPPYLGLIESRDAGRAWRPLSLRGEVDFHVLEARERTVYGYGTDFETRRARLLHSTDGGRSWTPRTPPEPLLGLAIDPGDDRRILAAGERRTYVSDDAGTTWRPVPAPGGMVGWTREVGPVALALDGTVRRAEQPLGEWTEVGSVDGEPAAFEASGSELLAATHDGRVLASTDGGAEWRRLFGG